MNGKRIALVAGCVVLATLGVLWTFQRSANITPIAAAPGGIPPARDREASAVPPTGPAAAPQTDVRAANNGILPAKPAVAYDPSVPLRRVVGETVKIIPAKSWRNTGSTTLADALETQYWAIAGGNVDQVEKSIVIDDSANATIEQLMLQAPPSVQHEYATLERFAAFLLAGKTDQYLGFSINSQRPISNVETLVRVDTLHAGVGSPYLHHETFRKGADGAWRRVITAKMVDDWAAGRPPKYIKGILIKPGQ